MSLSLLTSLTSYASPLRYNSNYHPKTQARPCTVTTTKKHRTVDISCDQQQNIQGEDRWIADRRNILVGLGGLTGVGVAAGIGSQVIMATGAPTDGASQMQKVVEFGSQPRLLNSTIRALVPRPKKSQKKSKNGKPVEILVVDGIDIPSDEPIRFDVYVAKPHGDQVGPDLGAFAGSLVDLARIRVGRNPPKGSLELGITFMVKEIGAEDCDKLVVTLVPRTGKVIIDGLRID